MHTSVPVTADAKGMRVGVATSRYHHDVTARLLDGARSSFANAGGDEANLVLVDAPGAFELIAIAHALALRSDIDAVVGLGCVLTGETTHDRYLCEGVAHGFAAITSQTGKPVAFGVLTCATLEQAAARSGGVTGAASRGNKGSEAMLAAVVAANAIARVARLPLGRPA